MNEAIAQQAQRLIATYPRQRPALSQAVAERYERQYLMNRSRHSWGGKLSGIAEAWMHRAVAADLSAQGPAPRVLEVGAGNLNHWRYEPSVKHYEVVEPFEALLATSPEREKLAAHYRDLAGAAALYSLLGTARLNGVNPLAYLTHVLKVINDHKVNAIEDLLPWRLKETEPSIRVAEATLIQASDRIH